MSFERSLSIADELDAEVNAEVRAVSLNLLTGLTRVTPVDTGRARGNWFVGIAKPKRDVDSMRTALKAITEGLAVFSIIKKRASLYDDVIISNNLPYIEKLNTGHSTQAPKKFVEKEIDRVANARSLRGR